MYILFVCRANDADAMGESGSDNDGAEYDSDGEGGGEGGQSGGFGKELTDGLTGELRKRQGVSNQNQTRTNFKSVFSQTRTNFKSVFSPVIFGQNISCQESYSCCLVGSGVWSYYLQC